MLTEKVRTLDLKRIKKNRSGAAKKGARKARLADPPSRNSPSSQPQKAPRKWGSPTSKHPHSDPAEAWKIWDPNKREGEINEAQAYCDWA